MCKNVPPFYLLIITPTNLISAGADPSQPFARFFADPADLRSAFRLSRLAESGGLGEGKQARGWNSFVNPRWKQVNYRETSMPATHLQWLETG